MIDPTMDIMIDASQDGFTVMTTSCGVVYSVIWDRGFAHFDLLDENDEHYLVLECSTMFNLGEQL